MKRVLALLLASLFLVAALTSCDMISNLIGGNKGGDKEKEANFEVPEEGYNGEPITIKFYHTMGKNLRDVLALYITEFNKLYPNITIEEEQIGNYDDVRDQISKEIIVGAQPDIAYCYPDHVAFYNVADAVAQLDNLIDSKIEVTRADGTKEILGLTDAQKADFIEGYYNEGKQFGDGLMYTMPFSKSTEVLYYNATFFAENNLKVPTTWDEMEEVCKKIKEIDPDSIPLGYDSESNWFITMCEQSGENFYTSADENNHYLFNNDTAKSFVKRFNDWYQKGYVTTQNIYGAYTSGLFVATKPEKVEGEAEAKWIRSYMSIGSSAGATHQRPDKVTVGEGAQAKSEYPFDVGIATIPQLNKAQPKVISQGPSVCIFANKDPQKVIASWLFVKFLTTNVEFQAEFSMVSGYVPVLKSVATNPIYAAFTAKADGGDNIAALSAKVCLEQENAYYTSPAFNGSSVARDQVGLIIKLALPESNLTDAKLDQIFQDAIDECEYRSGN